MSKGEGGFEEVEILVNRSLGRRLGGSVDILAGVVVLAGDSLVIPAMGAVMVAAMVAMMVTAEVAAVTAIAAVLMSHLEPLRMSKFRLKRKGLEDPDA